MSLIAAALAIAVQGQAVRPVSAADLRSLLDGVVMEDVGVQTYDHTEIFLDEGRYRFSGRIRLDGRYIVADGVLCRGVTLTPARPMRCERIRANDRGQLFRSGMNDAQGRNVIEIRFRPLPSDW